MISEEMLNRLRAIDTPTLCNAVEALKLRDRTEGFMGYDIRCILPELAPMVGFAVTATARSTVPGPPGDPSGAQKLWRAVNDSPKPAVVILKDVGPDRSRSCHYGDMMATLSKRLGAVGLVTDGGVRDLKGVKALGFQYFAAGVTPAHGNCEIVEVGLEVRIAGATVRPGDLIHADENGVAVFPPSIAKELLLAAQDVIERESARIEVYNSPGFKVSDLK